MPVILQFRILFGIIIFASTSSTETTHPFISSTLEPFESEIPSLNEDLQNNLFQSALSIASLHRTSRSSYQQLPDDHFLTKPKLHIAPNFMHSSAEATVLNKRANSLVDNIQEESANDNLNGVKWWDHLYFNHSNFFVATLQREIAIWKRTTEFSYSDLTLENAFAVLETSDSVQDCVLYSRRISFKEERLYLAVALTENDHSTIKVYDICFFEVTQVTFFKIKEPVVRLSFLEQLNEGTLIILTLTTYEQDPLIINSRKSQVHQMTALKISIPFSTDLVAFSFGGNNYIGVGNRTFCQIYSLGIDALDAEKFDSIITEDLNGLASFRIGGLQFITLISKHQQLVFQFTQNGLVFQQKLEISNVIDVYVFYPGGCMDIVLLAIARDIDENALLLFVWKDQFMPVSMENIRMSVRPAVRSLSSFSYDKTTFLMMVDRYSLKSYLFSINIQFDIIHDPVLNHRVALMQSIEQLEVLIHDQEIQAHSLNQIMKNAVRGLASVFAEQILTEIEVTLSTNAARHSEVKDSLVWDQSKITRDDVMLGFADVKKDVDRLEAELIKLEQEINDAVFLNDSSTITGHKDILGSVYSQNLNFIQLSVPLASIVDLQQELSSIYRTDRPFAIAGDLIVKGQLNIQGNLNVRQVNQLSLDNVMISTLPQAISRSISFPSKFVSTGNINMKNNVISGVHLNQTILLNKDYHLIQPLKFAQKIRISHTISCPLVDDVDLSVLAEQYLSLHHEQVILVETLITLLAHSSRVSDIRITGLVNGINIQDLQANLARLDKPTKFDENIILHHPIFEGGLIVSGRYDGVNFPASLFHPDRDQIITASKTFHKLSALDVSVQGKVDGLDLPYNILKLTGKDVSTNVDLTFNEIFVTGNLDVSGGVVDSKNLKSLLARSAIPLNNKFLNVAFLGTVIIEQHLTVDTYSSTEIELFKNDLIYSDDLVIEITGDIRAGFLEVPAIYLTGMISGYNLKDDFMHKQSDQIIKGQKIFRKSTLFERHLVTGNKTIDGVNIVDLSLNRISLHDTSVIMGPVSFDKHILIQGQITIVGKINGLSFPQEIVFKNGPTQLLTNKLFLGGFSAQDVIVQGHLQITTTLDGISITEFLKQRVTLTKDHILTGNFSFGVGNKAGHLDVVSVNDYDLQKFASQIMFASKPQTIFSESVSFIGTTSVIGELLTSNGINNLPFKDLSESVIWINKPNHFSESVTFMHSLNILENLVVPTVNNIDVVHYSVGAVKKTGEHLTGINVFYSDIHIDGNVHANTVNGIVLRKDILLATTDQMIMAKYHFKEFVVEKNLHPQSVCEINVSYLNQHVLRTNQHSILNGNIIFINNLAVAEDIDVVGTVNDIKLSVLQEGVVNFPNQPVQTVLKKTLTGQISILGDIKVFSVNGINFTKVIEDSVYVDKDSFVVAPKTFTDAVTVSTGEINIHGYFNATGRVDGVNIRRWVHEIFYLNRPKAIQEFSGVVTLNQNSFISGLLNVGGKINNVDVRTEVLLKNTNGVVQELVGTKTFSTFSSSSSISVSGLVNGHNLQALVEDTFMIYGDQNAQFINIGGLVVFNQEVEGIVNSFDLPLEVVRLNASDIYLNGDIVFMGELRVTGDLETKGLVCNVNIEKIASKAIFKDEDQIIDGNISFHDITFTDAIVQGHVAGLDLRVYENTFETLRMTTLRKQEKISSRYQGLDKTTEDLMQSVRRSGLQLQQIELYQTVNVTGYIVDTYEDRVEIMSMEEAYTTVATFTIGVGGHFVYRDSLIGSWVSLLSTVHLGENVFKLWADKQGNAALTKSGFALYNVSQILDGDMIGLGDENLLLATLHPEGCNLRRIPRSITDQTPDEPITIRLSGASSVNLLGVRSPILVALNMYQSSPYSCPANSDSSLHIYTWNLESGMVQFTQTFSSASRKLAHFMHNGFDYILKADRDTQIVEHPTFGLKLYRKNDNFFVWVSSLDILNIKDLEVFEDDLGQIYLAVTNGTHLVLGYMAGSKGFVIQSVVPCFRAHSISAVFTEDGTVLLGIGQHPEISRRKKGAVQFFKVSWTGIGNSQRTYRKWS